MSAQALEVTMTFTDGSVEEFVLVPVKDAMYIFSATPEHWNSMRVNRSKQSWLNFYKRVMKRMMHFEGTPMDPLSLTDALEVMPKEFIELLTKDRESLLANQ